MQLCFMYGMYDVGELILVSFVSADLTTCFSMMICELLYVQRLLFYHANVISLNYCPGKILII
jgi:hypothetical protein